MSKLFTPSGADLKRMVDAAMEKCDSAIAHTREQDALRRAALERAQGAQQVPDPKEGRQGEAAVEGKGGSGL